MAIAVYIKAPPKKPFRLVTKNRERGFFAFISLLGLSSIVFAAWPIVIWQIRTLPMLTNKVSSAPIPQAQVLSANTNFANVQVVQDQDGFSYFTTNLKPEGPRPKDFFITIPKLKIENAHVLVDDLKFYDNLSHFPGSALPGEVGNSFITGHSVLPQFADPKNYLTIFSKLPDLEVGDDIFVQLNDQTYHYIVQYARVVSPQDTSVLAPISPSSRSLTLMTCVPPGTNLKRLVVVTSLI